MTLPAITLREIRATSPSMSEVMRSCQLRAGLSRSVQARDYVLGNPKSWLGTAYHEVLERIAVATMGPAPDLLVEQLWTSAVDALHQRAMSHRLDRRFGEPSTWPGYHLARAAVRIRATELVNQMRGHGISHTSDTEYREPSFLKEEQFIAFEGKLVGRPDVVDGNDILDYKSGAILEFDELTQTEVVKAAYVRQLQIYGYLVHARFGRWPTRGVLLPLAGSGVEVALDPAACEREARNAVALLDGYNTRVAARRSAEEFANPSPAACKWCPFKLACPAFWRAVSPHWSGQLDGVVIDGTLEGSLRSISAGAALAASVRVSVSSESVQRGEIGPLNESVHLLGTAAVFPAADRVRVVGLRGRPDGKLVPTMRTTMVRVSEIPSVETDPGS